MDSATTGAVRSLATGQESQTKDAARALVQCVIIKTNRLRALLVF